MEKILLQKFSEDTVKEIMSVVRSKVNYTDVIEERYFTTKKLTNICICLSHGRLEHPQLLYLYIGKEINLFRIKSEFIIYSKKGEFNEKNIMLYNIVVYFGTFFVDECICSKL